MLKGLERIIIFICGGKDISGATSLLREIFYLSFYLRENYAFSNFPLNLPSSHWSHHLNQEYPKIYNYLLITPSSRGLPFNRRATLAWIYLMQGVHFCAQVPRSCLNSSLPFRQADIGRLYYRTALNMKLNSFPLFIVAMPDPSEVPFAKAATFWDQGLTPPGHAGAASSLPAGLTFIGSPSSVKLSSISQGTGC